MTDLIHCPSCRSRDVIGIEEQGVYDGVLFWACLECPQAWARFREGRLGDLSAAHAERWTATAARLLDRANGVDHGD